MTWTGIDQSYSGFAIVHLNEDGTYKASLEGFAPKEWGTGVDRLANIDVWLTERLNPHAQHIAMEGYAAGSKFGREQAGELGATVKRRLWSYYIDMGKVGYPTIVAPTQVKKWITGKGAGVDKNVVIKEVYKRYGVDFDDDNLADAFVLAQIAKAVSEYQLYGVIPELAYQHEIVKALFEKGRVHAEAPGKGA